MHRILVALAVSATVAVPAGQAVVEPCGDPGACVLDIYVGTLH